MTIYIFLALAICALSFFGFVWLLAACKLVAYGDAVNAVAAVRIQADEAERQDTILAAQLEAMKAPEVNND